MLNFCLDFIVLLVYAATVVIFAAPVLHDCTEKVICLCITLNNYI